MKTFKCDFGRGVSCEMHATDEPPPKGTSHIRKMEWEGDPSTRPFRPYVAWVNSINKTLADEWGIKLMHAFMTSPTTAEVWVYEPGKPPKKVSETGTENV